MSCLAALPLAAAVLSAGCTCGSGPYEGDYFDGDRPNSMKAFKFVESDKGDPAVMGCADGQREGFSDVKKHPRIAGCVGTWDGTKNLRDKPTGKACGDDGAACAVPADLCAPGWHVCGIEGKAKDITDRASANDCDNAGPGRFNAAVSHSISEEIDPCPKITPATTLPCFQAGLGSEPMCCGNDCLSGKCKDAVFKGKTRISRGISEGCGAVTSDANGGVMCCADGDAPPAVGAKLVPPPGGVGAAPAGGGAVAPAGGGAAPAADGGAAPAADGGAAPANGGAAPANGGAAPAADGGAVAPANGGAAPAADGGAKQGDAPAGDAKAGG